MVVYMLVVCLWPVEGDVMRGPSTTYAPNNIVDPAVLFDFCHGLARANPSLRKRYCDTDAGYEVSSPPASGTAAMPAD